MTKKWTGSRLRQARLAKGLTQKALGDAVGVSGAAVGNWENDVSQPTYENATRLSQVLAGEPAPDNLNRLRAVVEAQQQVLGVLIEAAQRNLDDDDELAARLDALAVVLGQRQLR